MAKNTTPRVPHQTPMFENPGIDDDRELAKWIEIFHKLPISRTWIIFWERLFSGEGGGGDGELKATFGLVRSLTVEDDLTNHFISRSEGTFVDLVVNAKIPPTGTAARIEIEKSTDEGATWNTIFPAPGYITLAIADDERQEFTSFATGAAGTIAVGDFLRINCTQKGSLTAGKNIEFVLRWTSA